MRKLLGLLCVLLVLCGCHQQKQIYPIVNNICFTANVNYEQHNYICNVYVTDNVLKLVVDAPENIKGLTFVVDKNETETKFNDISYSHQNTLSIHGNLAEIIYKIFNEVTDKTIINDDKNCKITDIVDNVNYEFVFSPSGLPLYLNIKKLGLNIIFSNVVIERRI